MKHSFPTPCPLWAEKLAATHPDDLTHAQHQELQVHLASCPTCSTIRAEYEVMGQFISQLPAVNPTPDLTPRLLHLLNTQVNHTTLISPAPDNVPPVLTYPSMLSLSAMNRPKRHIHTVASSLVTILVVAALLGSFLVLFTSHRAGTEHSGNVRTWHVISSANPGSTHNALLSVAALSTNSSTSAVQGLTLHWNGIQWSVIKSPNPGQSTLLSGITHIPGSNEVWTVGYYSNPGDKTVYTLTALYN